jgi:hypothetical protein
VATQTPYKHSPEDGTPEAEQQPWRIHVPLGSGPTSNPQSSESEQENPPELEENPEA